MDLCASACTFVLAAGKDRYLSPDVLVGFHRSGRRYVNLGDSWNSTDFRIADYYRQRGASEDFVKRALSRPMQDIWFAPHQEMIDSGYASAMWSDRTAGY